MIMHVVTRERKEEKRRERYKCLCWREKRRGERRGGEPLYNTRVWEALESRKAEFINK